MSVNTMLCTDHTPQTWGAGDSSVSPSRSVTRNTEAEGQRMKYFTYFLIQILKRSIRHGAPGCGVHASGTMCRCCDNM